MKISSIIPLSIQKFTELDTRFFAKEFAKNTYLYPSLVSSIVEEYLPKGATVFDPMCSNWAVVVGCAAANISHVGFLDKNKDIKEVLSFCNVNKVKTPLIIQGSFQQRICEYPRESIQFIFTELYGPETCSKNLDLDLLLYKAEEFFKYTSGVVKDNSKILITGKNFYTVGSELVMISNLVSLPARKYGFRLINEKIIQDHDFFSATATNGGAREELSHSNLMVYNYSKSNNSVFNIGFLSNSINKKLMMEDSLNPNSGMTHVRINVENKKIETFHLFSVVGINMNSTSRKVANAILKKLKSPPKVHLVHAPFVSEDKKTYDEFAVKVLIEIKDKLYQLGWITKKIDQEYDEKSPVNMFVAKWLDHDESSENSEKIIEVVKLADIGEFSDERGKILYYAKVMVRTKV